MPYFSRVVACLRVSQVLWGGEGGIDRRQGKAEEVEIGTCKLQRQHFYSILYGIGESRLSFVIRVN